MGNTVKIRSQWVWIGIMMVVTGMLAGALLWGSNAKHGAKAEQAHAHEENEKADAAVEKAQDEVPETLTLSDAQMQQQKIQLAQVGLGEIEQMQSFPAKLESNTDHQAHVSSSFAGRVESVFVELGQQVTKGQALATLLVPDVVDLQANLQMAESQLRLAQQDFNRERDLWSQGISAKQDYERATHAYRQAQIQVQAARTRLKAFAIPTQSGGRYTLKAPIHGVISSKDLVIGENVQVSDALFTIEQLDQLWLVFVMPSMANVNVLPNQQIRFKSLQTGNSFNAQVQSLSAQADAQTGRLQVRAKVLAQASELRPNLMVNVELPTGSKPATLRVNAQAVQQVAGQSSIFVAKPNPNKSYALHAVPVQIGQRSSDGQWVEITHGLRQGQWYVTAGSFVLKSELEKSEAEHGH